MGTRRLYLARHGDADAFGILTDVGRRQADLLGARLAPLSIDALWYSPLPRAAASAEAIAGRLPGVPVAAADDSSTTSPTSPARRTCFPLGPASSTATTRPRPPRVGGPLMR